MRPRPGRNLVWAVAVTGVCSLSALALPVAGWTVLAVGATLCLAAAAFDYVQLVRQLRTVSINRTLPAIAGRNLPFQAQWTVSGGGERPLRGHFRDEVPAVATPRLTFHPFELATDVGRVCNPSTTMGPTPDARDGLQTRPTREHLTRSITEELRIPVRGRHEFGPVWLRLTGPLGFLEGQRPFDCPGAVKVLPEQYASRDELMKDAGAEMALLDKVTFSRQQGAGTEFESLTEFRHGDNPRRIDWRTTAKHGRPVVRRYQVERHRDVMILIDCGRLMGAQTERGSKLDCAIGAAMILARVALQSGDRCGLGLFDHQVRGYLPPISSMNAVAECVYDARVAWTESDFTPMFATLQRRQAKRSLIIIISDVVDAETSTQFRGSLMHLKKRHLVLFAALRTPLLGRVVAEPVATMLDASRKAVTFRLLREREEALHTLHRGGIHILDVLPEQLTAPLINQFIDLRLKNVL